MAIVRAIVVHKAEAWTPTVGSLLLLFRDYGLKMWFRPEQINNYKHINHDDHDFFQDFEVFDHVAEHIRLSTIARKLDLLKYRTGRKNNVKSC